MSEKELNGLILRVITSKIKVSFLKTYIAFLRCRQFSYVLTCVLPYFSTKFSVNPEQLVDSYAYFR